MPLTVINGPTILAGESLSYPVDLTGGTLVRITMPKVWTDAELTFQISTDGDLFNDLYTYQHGEVRVPVTAGSALLLPPDMMRGIGFIKFRSGSASQPKPQPEQRDFAVAIETVAATRADEPATKPARRHR